MDIKNEVKGIVSEIVESKRKNGGIKRIVWIAAGGSNGGFFPAQYFMEREAKSIPSQTFTSNEFNYATPAYINESTLAIICSMRGTPETILAAKKAKKLGATTIALYVNESGLTKSCDFKIKYQSVAIDESNMGYTNSAIGLMLAMTIVNEIEHYDFYEDAMKGFDIVDPIYRKAVEYSTPLAQKWAKQNADRNPIYVLGSGPSWGSAYTFSICNIEEMLQICSPYINSCEFFHGPFEIVNKNTSIFLLVSVGRTRPADERCVKFLNQYGGDKVYILDAKELGVNDFSDNYSEYFNHLIFAPILNNVYMRQLSYTIKKDYNTRRYMWKVNY